MSRLEDLSNRVVMVSGAAGGMGGAIAKTLAAAGAQLSLSDLGVEAQDAIARDLGECAFATAGDLSRAGDAAAWTEATLARFGRIDGLVNVAGAWQIRDFLETTEQELQAMFAANLATAFHATQAVAPHMVQRGSGSIVNFASTAGEYGSISPAAHYAAAKGAVIGLTKSVARELSPLGIRVNAISPGPIDTPALAAGQPIDREQVSRRTLVGRLGTPADIAEAVLYLISDGSAFVTGHVLRVNGGSLL